jgi:DNA-binding transcriptional MerR regulator
MRKDLDALQQKKYVGVAELAEEAARVLRGTGPMQEKATVTEVPDERTIRYYLNEGLLSPAEEKQGTASVFSYRHLLQLLVIKKLQSEHLPIRKIRELVIDRKERELERLLGDEQNATPKNDAMRYLESLLTSPSRSVAPPSAFSATSAGRPTINPGGPTPPAPSMSVPMLSPPSPKSASGGAWQRIEIESGLELHVRSDYSPPFDNRGVRKLTKVILHAIFSYVRKPRR